MNWQETQQHYPHQWVVVKVLQAHSKQNRRVLDDLAVIHGFTDSLSAWREYTKLNRQSPQNEFYVLHTDHIILGIQERRQLGLQGVT